MNNYYETRLHLFPAKNISTLSVISYIITALSVTKQRKNGSWKIIRHTPEKFPEPQTLLLLFDGPGYVGIGRLLLIRKPGSIQVVYSHDPKSSLLAPAEKLEILFLFSNLCLFLRSKFPDLFHEICFHNLFGDFMPCDPTPRNLSEAPCLTANFEIPAFQIDLEREIMNHICRTNLNPARLHTHWKLITDFSFPYHGDRTIPCSIITLDLPDFKDYGYLRLRREYDRLSVDYITPFSFQKKYRYHAPFLLSLFARYLCLNFSSYCTEFQISYL